MSRLKNITASAISIQLFKTASPQVNHVSTDVIKTLQPGEDIDEALVLVSNIGDASYNSDLIAEYIKKGILTRISNA